MAKNDGKREEPEVAETSSSKVEFVKVRKGPDVLEVHPTTVTGHVKQGWKVVEG